MSETLHHEIPVTVIVKDIDDVAVRKSLSDVNLDRWSIGTVPTADSSVCKTDNDSLVSNLSDRTGGLGSTLYPSDVIAYHQSGVPLLPVTLWNGRGHFSDLVQEGLEWHSSYGKYVSEACPVQRDDATGKYKVIMLYECPSAANTLETSFFNSQVYRFHDWPPTPALYRAVLAPCRYSMMNGNTFPSYLKDGEAPDGLVNHWSKCIPDFVEPSFSPVIPADASAYAYLPIESLEHHVNDPYVHYHLAGKDAIHLMTTRTTKLLTNTKDHRPCICKTTHSMASKGIFVIRTDQDEQEFQQFLNVSGNPTYVITEYVEIERNVACHFFIHPSGNIIWFGSNENCRLPDGDWSTDSTVVMAEQDSLRQLQMPFVQDVARYCLSLGYWGFCGIDVLFDTDGKGHLVDVNPRVTGTCPSIMVAHRLQNKFGYEYCMFRRNSKFAYRGTAAQLLIDVDHYNTTHEGSSMIVLAAFGDAEKAPNDPECRTLVNMGVYSAVSLNDCLEVLEKFAPLNEFAIPGQD
jgi:ATP-grasp domain